MEDFICEPRGPTRHPKLAAQIAYPSPWILADE